jgi:hypothetical protein
MRVVITRVTPATKKEDDRLRDALKNADIEKFKKAIKRVIKPKRTRHDRTKGTANPLPRS